MGPGKDGQCWSLPNFSDLSALVGPVISVALMGYMESMTIAKTTRKRFANKQCTPGPRKHKGVLREAFPRSSHLHCNAQPEHPTLNVQYLVHAPVV